MRLGLQESTPAPAAATHSNTPGFPELANTFLHNALPGYPAALCQLFGAASLTPFSPKPASLRRHLPRRPGAAGRPRAERPGERRARPGHTAALRGERPSLGRSREEAAETSGRAAVRGGGAVWWRGGLHPEVRGAGTPPQAGHGRLDPATPPASGRLRPPRPYSGRGGFPLLSDKRDGQSEGGARCVAGGCHGNGRRRRQDFEMLHQATANEDVSKFPEMPSIDKPGRGRNYCRKDPF
ncbi:PREDICTED: translation initiation factor IF-2-like [Calidris pugnax]|uniref:translation initiation factor IF-2-like n=1 Tax=Calidris pugnax TaxID=198806 RepID=UPI00071D4F1B|nr:PREDICTED: translation initiation factor IF-2-like [Calidris pugnax]